MCVLGRTSKQVVVVEAVGGRNKGEEQGDEVTSAEDHTQTKLKVYYYSGEGKGRKGERGEGTGGRRHNRGRDRGPKINRGGHSRRVFVCVCRRVKTHTHNRTR